MLLKDVKELLFQTGDLRLLTKNNGEVRITDLFLNGDGKLRLEQYSTINKKELEEHSSNGVINGDTLDSLLGCVKLWTLFEEDETTDENSTYEYINWFFENYDVDKIIEFPKLDFNDTVIEFMDSSIDEMLYIGISSLN